MVLYGEFFDVKKVAEMDMQCATVQSAGIRVRLYLSLIWVGTRLNLGTGHELILDLVALFQGVLIRLLGSLRVG